MFKEISLGYLAICKFAWISFSFVLNDEQIPIEIKLKYKCIFSKLKDIL
jgi:hypothetical protein